MFGKKEDKVLIIDGMHCEMCQAKVSKALNEIPGVSAKVNLKKGEALIFGEVSDEELKETVEALGFTVTSISK